MSTIKISDHKARVCECGSVNYALLHSQKIECNSCGEIIGCWFGFTILDDIKDSIINIESTDCTEEVMETMQCILEDLQLKGEFSNDH